MTFKSLTAALIILVPMALTGCQCEEGEDCLVGEIPGEPQAAVVYPLTQTPYTALQKTWKPTRLSDSTKALITSGELTVYDHEHFHEHGIGVEEAEGTPWLEHQELAPDFVEGEPAQRKSLAYFWIVADPQVIDEESPIRMENFDKVYRPQGHYTPQVFEAHVRTAERLSQLSSRRFDFALLAGDLTDGGQKNEVDWLLTTMNGGIINPDSGVDNDPVPGPGNDHNDPFISDGLSAPWFAALGNHDSLYNGGFGTVTQQLRNAATGDHLYISPIFGLLGWHGYIPGDDTRDSRDTVITNPAVKTPPDPHRYPLTINEIIDELYNAGGTPQGHGFTPNDASEGKGYFSYRPSPEKPIRLIVLHTTDSHEVDITLAFEGSMDQIQFNWLQEQLTLAEQNQELVIIMSHHRLSDFHRKSEVHPSTIEALFLAHKNIALHVTGHGHKNTKTLHSAFEHGGYWELMTASTMDFPMQSRIVEIVDEGNDFISIYVTNVDHNSPENSMSHKARHLAAGKNAFTLAPFFSVQPEFLWREDVPSQNLLLRTKVSAGTLENIRKYEWSNSVESEEILKTL